MFKTALFLLCSVAILVSGADDAVISSSTIPTTITTTSSSSTNATSTPSTSTTPSIPITTKTSSTTHAPTTTSTSTSAPTTTSTSTSAPTTTPSPSPTPAPAPVPPPETGKWIVNGTDNKETCIIAQMALQFNVSYMTKENKTAYKVLDLPGNNKTLAQGKCGTAADLEQNITLSWNATNSTAPQNSLMLHFIKNITKNQYALHHLELYLSPEELPQILTNYSTTFVHRSDQFTTGLNNSYRCLKTQTLNLTTVDNKTVGEISVSNLQFQAFHVENTSNFGFAEDCAFDTPDIVPIAVGCALAALVVIVLIAYLVGRRRSQARGYLSM